MRLDCIQILIDLLEDTILILNKTVNTPLSQFEGVNHVRMHLANKDYALVNSFKIYLIQQINIIDDRRLQTQMIKLLLSHNQDIS